MRTIILLFLAAGAWAQSVRMNATLIKALHSDKNKTYAVLVKGDVNLVKNFTKQHQGLFKYNCGPISSVCLKGNDLIELAGKKNIDRIEYYEKCAQPLDDTSIIKNDVLKIHNGVSPLPGSYDGKGVTFGFVDTGIDFTHPDFKDSLGKTRIKWIWDQTLSTGGVTPQPYNYGQEWDNVQIDSGHCTHDDIYDMGHGTKVAGIAAGNGNTNVIYKGLAPKADIICAALDFSSTGPVVLDGINYVVSKAVALNQPFVLNLSIGDYFGSHDGKDLQAQGIDALFANIPGRCVVAAEGNSGDQAIHLQNTLGADTNFTFINAAPQTQFLLYADTLSGFKQAYYTIGVYDSSYRYIGNIGYRTINSCMGTMINDTIFNANHDRIGIIQTAADYLDDSYEMLFSIVADSSNYHWTLEATGQGKFDTWNYDFVQSSLPSAGTLPRMTYYKRSDTLQTICTSFQCSDEVITVANYTERTGHISCQHTFYQMPGPYDTLVYYVSRGPTRDNRLKPDISATGENILTTCQLVICNYLAVNFPTTNGIVCEDTMHIIFQGTSAASPSAAGVALLYLQKNPTATNHQIKNAITGCARQDYYTGNNLPNINWGYGKLDGFNALTCGSMNAQSMLLEKVGVSPNPTTQDLRFDFGKDEDATIKIYSLEGNLVKELKVSGNSLSVPVQNLASGLYLYRVFRNDALSAEGKFVKE
jgi:subtilisin family serine protease